ncbi:hypothetical protein ACFSTC_47455 [Nonomuraea ferruginea]
MRSRCRSARSPADPCQRACSSRLTAQEGPCEADHPHLRRGARPLRRQRGHRRRHDPGAGGGQAADGVGVARRPARAPRLHGQRPHPGKPAERLRRRRQPRSHPHVHRPGSRGELGAPEPGQGAEPVPGGRLDRHRPGDGPLHRLGGQRLPRHFRRGLSVVNHSGSGESSASFLAKPAMWAAMRDQLGPGDVALVQFGHNDKHTSAVEFRANLTRLVHGIEARGAAPVLVTPVVRRRFRGGCLDQEGLIVNGLGVDLLEPRCARWPRPRGWR